MLTKNLIAKIEQTISKDGFGRIGGNIPRYFEDKQNIIEGYNFYASFKNPTNNLEYISVFTPKSYSEMIDGNIYPNCSVRVFTHCFSDESDNHKYTIDYINKTDIAEYIEVDSKKFDFITVTRKPMLIQDEKYYEDALKNDGYEFFIQIDEDYYPEGLINGNYIFGYGALYLYKNKITEKIVAGFWQYS